MDLDRNVKMVSDMILWDMDIVTGIKIILDTAITNLEKVKGSDNIFFNIELPRSEKFFPDIF